MVWKLPNQALPVITGTFINYTCLFSGSARSCARAPKKPNGLTGHTGDRGAGVGEWAWVWGVVGLGAREIRRFSAFYVYFN